MLNLFNFARRRRYAILLCSAVVVALAGAGLWIYGQPQEQLRADPERARRMAQLAQARERWRLQRPQHYRLVVQGQQFDDCRQVLVVQDEQVTQVVENTCHFPLIGRHSQPMACQPRTIQQGDTVSAVPNPACEQPIGAIDDLFALVDQHINQEVCGANGCRCDGVMVADVEYDQHSGYPTRVRIWLDESLRKPAPLQLRLRSLIDRSALACTAMGTVDRLIEVESLTPLP